MKVFIIVIVLFVIFTLFYFYTDVAENVEHNTKNSEHCDELRRVEEDEDYNFSYNDRIRQISKGCL